MIGTRVQRANNATAAVIDVGTNSVKILAAEWQGEHLTPLYEASEQTRLGDGFFATHELRDDAIVRTTSAVEQFFREAQRRKIDHVSIIGTSAARDASNRDALIRSIHEATGKTLELISGEQEAQWVFRGVGTDARFAGRDLLVVDVGGGSTELITGRDGVCRDAASIALGTIRLLQESPLADPPGRGDLTTLRGRLLAQLAGDSSLPQPPFSSANTWLVGTGGTTTILARLELKLAGFDRAKIDSIILMREQVNGWTDRLWSVARAEREKFPGLPRNRADVILFGAALIEAIMSWSTLPELRISTRGLRFGALAK